MDKTISNKRILVTGGAGFIGSNFVHYWLKHHPSDSIVVLDKLTYAGNIKNLDSIKEKITFVQGDICDSNLVDVVMEGVHTVVHFAAESHVDRSIESPAQFIETNVLGTGVLLASAKKHGVSRFHHVSTDEVFGHIALDSSEKWTEQSPYNPRSPYSASKAASDHLVRAYYHTYKFPVTISNCANNIGPYMFPEKFIPLAVTNILEGKKVPVYKPGNQVREWLYVEDHCSGIEAILVKGLIGETYFIGPENPEFSNLEVIKKVLDIMKVSEEVLEFVEDRAGHDQKYALDHSKITRELGWKPAFNLDQALTKTVTWYQEHAEWWKPLKNN